MCVRPASDLFLTIFGLALSHSPDAQDARGRTALALCCMGESTQDGVGMRAYAEAAMALLARGASVNIEDAGACRHGGKSWLQITIEYVAMFTEITM